MYATRVAVLVVVLLCGDVHDAMLECCGCDVLVLISFGVCGDLRRSASPLFCSEPVAAATTRTRVFARPLSALGQTSLTLTLLSLQRPSLGTEHARNVHGRAVLDCQSCVLCFYHRCTCTMKDPVVLSL